MTHNAAIDSQQSYSLLPASDQDTSAPRAGFLARLEADGTAPGIVGSTAPQRSVVGWVALLVLLAVLAAVAAWLYLSPEPSSEPSARSVEPAATPAPTQRTRQAAGLPELDLPVSAESLALQALTSTEQSPLERFSALAGLNTDIDALATALASEVLPPSLANEWQPAGFASVLDIDADALDAIPVTRIKPRRAAPARRSRADSDAELLEMLMRRLDQGN